MTIPSNKPWKSYRLEQSCTFWDIDIALPIIDNEAPEETGDEVHQQTADVVPQPRLEEVRQAPTRVARYDVP